VIDSVSILIIGGEPNLRGNLASALTEVGFTVGDMRDYPEALQKLDESKPDITIVDEALPSGDGKEVCHKLRNAFGIPALLLGKDSSGEAWKAAVEAGADFYFTNSFNRRVLASRVKATLRRYKEKAGCSGNQGRLASPKPEFNPVPCGALTVIGVNTLPGKSTEGGDKVAKANIIVKSRGNVRWLTGPEIHVESAKGAKWLLN